ncbi:hypothetical protein BDM02DRAFT_3120473 [Thelephora ganbajun]|uniref:Uncharacterized protein n=1 Tax=Thelephora ganbajun TaxID=370292 RepID=A0ACB6Z6F4_THEGA|nr:hypothetical protein BDM02DRAFT_3120473 [Thelephora ganbajun]
MDFEAARTYQNVFLRIRGEVLVVSPGLLGTVSGSLFVRGVEGERVLDIMASSLGTSDFVREVL